MRKKYLLIMIMLLMWNLYSLTTNTAQASEQKIQWQLYSNSIFKQAQDGNRLILLYGKAEWCHWCKKMQETTFQNEEVINTINSSYIPVQVDIDKDSQIAIGYKIVDLPTTIIMSSDQKILKMYTGYIEPSAYLNDLNQNAHQYLKIQTTATKSITVPNVVIKKKPLMTSQVYNQLLQKQLLIYKNARNSNWGTDPNHKYFDPASLELAISIGIEGNAFVKEWAEETLDSQFQLLDPIWGGMYRESTNGDWLHPNYEKRMTDQAEGIRIYAEAYRYWRNPAFLLAAEKIAQYLTSKLQTPEGVFYNGQQAYITAGKQNAEYYQLDDAHRRALGIPAIDQHIYTDANGIAINAYTFLYMMTGNKYYLDIATKAVKWIVNHNGANNGGFYREKNDLSGYYLSDNLAMTRAFLTLYKATTDMQYLLQAEKTLDFIATHFQNPSDKLGYVSFSPLENMQNKEKQVIDPAQNGMLARVSTLMYHYTGITRFQDIANNAMQYLLTPSVIENANPAIILLAYKRITDDPLHITIVGPKSDFLANQLYSAALAYPSFYARIEWWDRSEGALPNLDVEYPILNKSAAFVCMNHHCSLPIYSPQHLGEIIQDLIITPKNVAAVVQNIEPTHVSQSDNAILNLLSNKSILLLIPIFIFLGFLLAFTPCIFPLLLVIAGMICNECAVYSKWKIFRLSLTYVISLTLTYVIAGMIAAFTGVYLQVYFQESWVIAVFAIFFILLSLSLFGLYQIQFPESWRRLLVRKNNLRMISTYAGVLVMGSLATLIAAPCAAAPMVTVLGYVMESHNISSGIIVLCSMGIGIGTPLLIATTLGSKYLPAIGPWQKHLQIFFGFITLGFAFWLLQRILLPQISLILWSGFIIYIAIYLGALKKNTKNNFNILVRTISVMILIYGIFLLFTAFSNNSVSLFKSSGSFSQRSSSVSAIIDKFVHNQKDLNEVYSLAQMNHKPIILDFYADWCESCKKFDKDVLSDSKINGLVNQFIFARVDLTTLTPDLMSVAKQFHVIAPPAIIFLDENGSIIKMPTIIYNNSSDFYNVLQQVLSMQN